MGTLEGFKGSSGPWRVVQVPIEIVDPHYLGSGDPTVWGTGIANEDDNLVVPHSISINYNDAKLIAAAPELLEMLVKVVKKEVDRYEADLRHADQHNNTDGVGIDFPYYTEKPLDKWIHEAQGLIKKATE